MHSFYFYDFLKCKDRGNKRSSDIFGTVEVPRIGQEKTPMISSTMERRSSLSSDSVIESSISYSDSISLCKPVVEDAASLQSKLSTESETITDPFTTPLDKEYEKCRQRAQEAHSQLHKVQEYRNQVLAYLQDGFPSYSDDF
eukprot:gnl/Carplike_NY0171/5164_a7048_279.p1 GENE.gnl/Carplike_NY0171/5164_a7048_279~~gnl/Carplike_NY0171/5164_a7048_279.p1  ORF type:complete len:142 (+),score=18.24 gnl/Carplike_NY0171/5164_a7048_279:1-426(+)